MKSSSSFSLRRSCCQGHHRAWHHHLALTPRMSLGNKNPFSLLLRAGRSVIFKALSANGFKETCQCQWAQVADLGDRNWLQGLQRRSFCCCCFYTFISLKSFKCIFKCVCSWEWPCVCIRSLGAKVGSCEWFHKGSRNWTQVFRKTMQFLIAEPFLCLLFIWHTLVCIYGV